MPLVFVNTRNHCYSNVAVQLLFNIIKIRHFFMNENFRTNGSNLPMPICEALSVIFKTNGTTLSSTEVLRCLVGKKSGINNFCEGSMEDSLFFLHTLLKMLKEEIPRNNLEAQEVLEAFDGEEKVKRFFLNTTVEGHCPNCQNIPNASKQKICWLIPELIDTQIPLKLSTLMDRYFTADIAEMKCSVCCKHQSNCPLTGLCKMKPIIGSKCLSNSPNQLLIQLNRFNEDTRTRIPTIVEADEILEFPSEENGEKTCVQYKLSTVIDHIGNTRNSGHYIAYVKENFSWMKCNDSNISASSEAQFRTKNNYIYHYSRINKNNIQLGIESKEEKSLKILKRNAVNTSEEKSQRKTKQMKVIQCKQDERQEICLKKYPQDDICKETPIDLKTKPAVQQEGEGILPNANLYQEQYGKSETKIHKTTEDINVFILKNKEVSLSLEENLDGSMKCPFCEKLVKRILTHFNRDKNCKLKIESKALESLKNQIESYKRKKSLKTWKENLGMGKLNEQKKIIMRNGRKRLEGRQYPSIILRT